MQLLRKPAVLFVCIRNSARSQMAEALLKNLCPNDFDAESAGLEPGELDPVAVAAMKELGIDISRNRTKSVFDMIRSGKHFSYVITVCDETSAERCPIFPGIVKRVHWSFPDPASFMGSWDERLELTRDVRDRIGRRVEAWCDEMCAASTAGA